MQQQKSKRLVGAAFPILFLFLFVIFSGLFEVLPLIHDIRPQLIVGGIGLIILLMTGHALRVIKSPAGIMLTLFTLWFIICIPFSVWRGGSFGILINIWYKSALTFVLAAGLLNTLDQAKRLFRGIGYAVGLLSLIALAINGRQLGRLMVPNTRYANANDLAWTLLLGLVFLGFGFASSTGAKRIISALLMAPVLLALSMTGSRAALLGAVALCVFAFFQAPKRVRTKLAMGIPLVVIVLAVLLPADLRDRYVTLFEKSDDQGSMSYAERRRERAAIGSAESRFQLLKDSIVITLQHPLFGVGPGNFPVAQNDLAIDRGEPRGFWLVAHNTYTELSSEMGIPGLIIYLLFIYKALSGLTSIIRSRRFKGRDWDDLRLQARTVRLAIVVILPVAFFDSFCYDTNIPILAGLATALGFIAGDLRRRSRLKQETVAAAVREPAEIEPMYEPAWTGLI